jgi:hypothetical protein
MVVGEVLYWKKFENFMIIESFAKERQKVGFCVDYGKLKDFFRILECKL